MPQFANIRIHPDHLHDVGQLKKAIAKELGISQDRINHFTLRRRSIDARGRKVLYQLRYEVWVDEEVESVEAYNPNFKDVHDADPVHIIGMGPAGLFAALALIQEGKKPVIIERGKDVRARRRDLAALNKQGIVNPESNYCFGEGGAGTYSDGKLYTRSLKRGNVREVLELLVHFGATPDILIDAHPHIGTNKLPGIISEIRECIIERGGEVHFDTKLTDLEVQGGRLKSIQLNGDSKVSVNQLILATGHSARDIFELLHRKGIRLEAKPFALGVRVEHPQPLIDQIQYHCSGIRHENLPAASYSLVRQAQERGVYSFCMCPGGIICPAATAEGELVVNGWSPSKRNSPYANSGIVVELQLEDFMQENNPLSGMHFQATVEQKAFKAGGGQQKAPSQRLVDFLSNTVSSDLPDCSYLPGLHSSDLREVLPSFVHNRLEEAFRYFGQRLKGYLTNEAVAVAVESRTSSPIRIPRDPATRMHPQVEGLIPCGEGAGYAGGIMSAAMDGMACGRVF